MTDQPARRDCPACDVGIEHTEHCPTPETHNWGCGCPTDEMPAEPDLPDERDYCPACNGTVHTCVCSDLVTPHPSQL